MTLEYLIPDILIVCGFVCGGLYLVMAHCEANEIKMKQSHGIKARVFDVYKNIRKRRTDIAFSIVDLAFPLVALILRIMAYNPYDVMYTILAMFAINIFVGQLFLPLIFDKHDLDVMKGRKSRD